MLQSRDQGWHLRVSPTPARAGQPFPGVSRGSQVVSAARIRPGAPAPFPPVLLCVTAAWRLQTWRCLVVSGTTEEPPQVVWECSSANERGSATAGTHFPALSRGREHSKHLWSKAGGTPKFSPGPSSCNPSVTLTTPLCCSSSWRVPKGSASGILQDCPGTWERLCQQHSV